MITLTKKHKKRLWLIVLLLLGISTAVTLAVVSFRENMLYYFSPTQIMANEAPKNHAIRLGGMVQAGSIKRDPNSLKVTFDVTDYENTITVNYEGILPDLFREGQGVVAIGHIDENGVVNASEVLAKHDENYMPPEVAASLKEPKAN